MVFFRSPPFFFSGISDGYYGFSMRFLERGSEISPGKMVARGRYLAEVILEVFFFFFISVA